MIGGGEVIIDTSRESITKDAIGQALLKKQNRNYYAAR